MAQAVERTINQHMQNFDLDTPRDPRDVHDLPDAELLAELEALRDEQTERTAAQDNTLLRHVRTEVTYRVARGEWDP